MIVCVCHNVNDRALDVMLAEGADSVRAIGDACGAGRDCGQCARDLLAHLKKRRPAIQPVTADRVPISK